MNYVANKQLKKQLPQIKTGHIVAVHQKIKEGSKERIQVFKGIVIRVKNGYGLNGSFTVRRVASGVGVEKTFLFNSPLVEKIEVMKKAKTRRAKLYYLRGLYGKSAKLNLMGEKDGAEELIRDIVGEEEAKEEKTVGGEADSKAQEKVEKEAKNDKKDGKREDVKNKEEESDDKGKEKETGDKNKKEDAVQDNAMQTENKEVKEKKKSNEESIEDRSDKKEEKSDKVEKKEDKAEQK